MQGPFYENVFQGLTLTFQLTSQEASDNLNVTTISVCLPAKLASGLSKTISQK